MSETCVEVDKMRAPTPKLKTARMYLPPQEQIVDVLEEVLLEIRVLQLDLRDLRKALARD